MSHLSHPALPASDSSGRGEPARVPSARVPSGRALTTLAVSRRAALLGALGLATLPLAACTSGADNGTDSDGGSAADGNGASAGNGASDGGTGTNAGTPAPLTVTDPWVKAAESGMTAAFATLRNTSNQPVQLIGASTPAAGMVELHETISDGSGGMSMQEKEGGFAIPVGGELLLEPGGNHLMLMDLPAPLAAGESIEIVLELEGGVTIPFTATVKDFAGAQEHYEPEGSSCEHASDGGGH